MVKHRWWGAPPHVGPVTPLARMDHFFTGVESTIHEAQPLTVRIRGAMIREDEDWGLRKDNDIVIATTYQFGTQPPIQRLHFMKNDVPLGWQNDFFHDVIVSERDFKDRILTLRVQVYDMDGVPEGLVDAVRGVSTSAAVAFPFLAQYAGAVAFAVPPLLRLVDHLDDHDMILDRRLKLETGNPGTGRNLLQPGYFVLFKDAVDEGFYVNQDLRVLEDQQGKEFSECSYAVLGVSRQFTASHEWEIDQKAAKLIAELNGKGQSGRAAIEFLRETLDGYSSFKKLQRARELQDKTDVTSSEKELLDELLANDELAPFLKVDHVP